MAQCSEVFVGVLERLDVVAAPATQTTSPLSALSAALRAAQGALEASQSTVFGLQVSLQACHISHRIKTSDALRRLGTRGSVYPWFFLSGQCRWRSL